MAYHFSSYSLAAIISMFVASTVWADEKLNGNYVPPGGNTFVTNSSQSPPQFQYGSNQLGNASIDRRSSTDTSNFLIRRLPPITVEPVTVEPVAAEPPRMLPQRVVNAQSENSINGTWSKDGQYFTINLNGQELKLTKADAKKAGFAQPENSSGEVRGHLSNSGDPLANCLVALIPLTKKWNGYEVNGMMKPLRTKSDDDGAYRFTDVPPGHYKLSWLPQGKRQWNRRNDFRPDVHVKANKIAKAREIRVLLSKIK